jgi:rhodanese-related sulfurtransferase
MSMSPSPLVPTVSAAVALTMIDEGVALIDVREVNEWQAGHAPTAVHVPMNRIGGTAASFDKTRPIIFVCRSGRRSDAVTGAMVSAGYQALNLVGGMQAWQQAGGDVVRDDGTPGMVI